MRISVFVAPLAVAACLAMSTAAPAEAQAPKKIAWKIEKSDEYGISMKVPKGMALAGKEWKNGWAGLHGNYLGVQLWGLTHKGVKHTVPQFQIFGVLVTGIPGKQWRKVDGGKNQNGWKWWKLHRANKGKYVVFALYGVGEKGSYMFVLKTTRKSFNRDREHYLRWYRSLRTF